MTTKTPEALLADASAWWDTSIIDIHPGKIAIRGYPIEELIGNVRFPDMIWLMLRGELPTRAQGDLLVVGLNVIRDVWVAVDEPSTVYAALSLHSRAAGDSDSSTHSGASGPKNGTTSGAR